MKAIILFILMITLSAKADAEINGKIKTGLMSKYIARSGATLDTSPVVINQITLTKDDWYVDLWSSTSTAGNRYGTSYGDEVDLSIGWSHEFDWVKLDLCVAYCLLADFRDLNNDLWSFEPEISFPRFPYIVPYIRGSYFGQIGSRSPDGGAFCYAGFRKGFLFSEFEGRSCSLNLDVSVAYSCGGIGSSTGFIYGKIMSSLDLPIGKHWTLTPVLSYQVAAPGRSDDPRGLVKGNELVGGFTLSRAF